MMPVRLQSIPSVASIALLVIAIADAGCGGLLPTPDLTDPSPAGIPAAVDDFGSTIDVSNGTTLAVTILVNGRAVVVVPAGRVGTVKPGLLPPKPWAVEARTASGLRLLAFVVGPGQVTRVARPDGGVELRGAGSRVDLSCGRLDVTVGPPMLGPAPGPGRPGDCDA